MKRDTAIFSVSNGNRSIEFDDVQSFHQCGHELFLKLINNSSR